MFAKIFSTIYDSSIADDWQTRIVFQDMLILSDKDGIIDMTPQAISRRTNIPLEMVLAALPKLEAPDPVSRTPDQQGRRIERLEAHREWGWRIINYIKYRESATREMLRMAEADRKRAYRQRVMSRTNGTFTSPLHPPQKQKQRGEAEKSLDVSGTFDDSLANRDISEGSHAAMEGLHPTPPVSAVGKGGRNPSVSGTRLAPSEAIAIDHSIQRIDKRLRELQDANLPAFKEEKRTLKADKAELLAKLNLKH